MSVSVNLPIAIDEFDVIMDHGCYTKRIVVGQHETDREIYLNFVRDNGSRLELPGNESVELAFRIPGEEARRVTLSKDIFSSSKYAIKMKYVDSDAGIRYLTDNAAEIMCQIIITQSDTEVVTSAPFIIAVEKSVY